GKSKNVSSVCRSLVRHSTALSYLGAYFSAKVVIAASAAARFGDSQISRRSLCARRISHVGMFSSVNTNSIKPPTSAETAGLGQSGGKGRQTTPVIYSLLHPTAALAVPPTHSKRLR